MPRLSGNLVLDQIAHLSRLIVHNKLKYTSMNFFIKGLNDGVHILKINLNITSIFM